MFGQNRTSFNVEQHLALHSSTTPPAPLTKNNFRRSILASIDQTTMCIILERSTSKIDQFDSTISRPITIQRFREMMRAIRGIGVRVVTRVPIPKSSCVTRLKGRMIELKVTGLTLGKRTRSDPSWRKRIFSG